MVLPSPAIRGHGTESTAHNIFPRHGDAEERSVRSSEIVPRRAVAALALIGSMNTAPVPFFSRMPVGGLHRGVPVWGSGFWITVLENDTGNTSFNILFLLKYQGQPKPVSAIAPR